MRIAVVSQAFDRVVPPHPNSVGGMTRQLALALAGTDEVRVYGCRDVPAHRRSPAVDGADGVEHRFLADGPVDRLVRRGWRWWAPLAGAARHGLRPPLSTSARPGQGYGRRVAADLAADPVDVVHVQHSGQLVPLLRRALPPSTAIVLHLHAEWFAQTPRAHLVRRVRDADLVLGVSDHVVGRVRARVPEAAGRLVTLPDGVCTRELRPREGPADRFRHRILYAGALSPHKGVHDLVAAFGAVARADPSAELTVVGPAGVYPLEEVCPLDDPAAVARLRPYYGTDYGRLLLAAVPADLAGRVHFPGAVPRAELVELIRAADVVVFPSLWDEGFGLPPVEAMAASVPVVVTRSGALAETVVDGRTGLVVDKGRPEALAAAILRLLGDDALRAGMGAAGRRHVEARYAWPVVARRARELYASAVAARAGTHPPPGVAG